MIYGFHAVNSHIISNANNISMVYIDSKRSDKRLEEIIKLCQKSNIEINIVTTNILDKLSKGNKHQGVVANIVTNNPQKYSLDELLEIHSNKTDSILLILDGITDPHNLGAIIRTAECFGVDGVILPKDNSANTTNTSVAKTSSGAINNIPVITVTNINRTIDRLKENEYWIAGTTLGENSVSLFDFDFKGRLVIVMGNEERGIRRLIQENCDFLVTIPMFGTTQSLNVSVASGVVLSHIRFIQRYT